MVRAEIEVHAVLGDTRKTDDPKEWDFFVDKQNKIAYVRLATFSKTAAQELRSAIEQLEKEGVRGLVLDLRHNPGGLLKAAVEISDLFLTNGVIVSTRGRDQEQEIYKAKESGTLLLPAEKFPIAVLINKYSASASEIVAAALQDHGRAVVVGERSFGKGSVQNVIEMKEGNEKSALKLTTASYWRPNGKNIHRFPDAKESDEWGVKPNPGYEVPLTLEDEIAYMKYRIDRDVVQGKNGAKPAAKPKSEKEAEKDKKPFEDKVLQKALEYLRGEIKKVGAADRKVFEIRNG
jgi:carboxyl-terminal processing protease